MVQGVKSSQSNELEFVAHRAQFFLEFRDGRVVQILPPIERRGAVVGQHFPREFGVNRFGEFARLAQMWLGSLAPQQVGVRSIRNSARDGGFQAAPDLVEAFRSALAGNEFMVARIDVGRQQVGAVRVGARHDHGRHAHHVRRQARRDQLLNAFHRGNQNFSAEVSALFRGRQLIFEMHASGSRFDHGLHQLKRV